MLISALLIIAGIWTIARSKAFNAAKVKFIEKHTLEGHSASAPIVRFSEITVISGGILSLLLGLYFMIKVISASI
jgi:hypothetical protein